MASSTMPPQIGNEDGSAGAVTRSCRRDEKRLDLGLQRDARRVSARLEHAQQVKRQLARRRPGVVRRPRLLGLGVSLPASIIDDASTW